MTYYFRWDELESELITPGYSPARGPKVEGEKILMGIFHFPVGKEAKPHTHPNEQIGYVVKGKVRSRIGGEEKVLGPGDVFLIPANTEHGGGEILEEMEVIVCKDVVPGWSLKNARWESKE